LRDLHGLTCQFEDDVRSQDSALDAIALAQLQTRCIPYHNRPAAPQQKAQHPTPESGLWLADTDIDQVHRFPDQHRYQHLLDGIEKGFPPDVVADEVAAADSHQVAAEQRLPQPEDAAV